MRITCRNLRKKNENSKRKYSANLFNEQNCWMFILHKQEFHFMFQKNSSRSLLSCSYRPNPDFYFAVYAAYSMTSFLCLPHPGRTYSIVINIPPLHSMSSSVNALRRSFRCFLIFRGSPAFFPPKARLYVVASSHLWISTWESVGTGGLAWKSPGM